LRSLRLCGSIIYLLFFYEVKRIMKTPKGLRLQIGIFGRRNVGKSSFLNALTNQEVSIVSTTPGTTTDPVEKAMELLPIGPVLFIDTAGIDDLGALGEMRIEKTLKAVARSDVAAVITEAGFWSDFEDELLTRLSREKVPAIVIFNKSDLAEPAREITKKLDTLGVPWMTAVASEGIGIDTFKELLLEILPADFITARPIVGDLMAPGETIVLVVPIDLEAPRGRLILPQVQTIRDVLDHDGGALVVKERDLPEALDNLKKNPALVITDSQAFETVARDTPLNIPMTSFSILFARFKGDLPTFAAGASAIDQLKPGARVLISEACTHHPICDDIGRVKIPQWLNRRVGHTIDFEVAAGHDFPDNLDDYSLVIHCGSCMFNRREVLSRIMECSRAGVPITNYGMAIAYCLGIFKRALAPFPEVSSIVDILK
jgi:[FeFe] hydrogenase H-cluster maturation GTPase HydF